MSTQCGNSLYETHPLEPETVRKNWGWFLAFGIALIVFGVLAFSLPNVVSLAVEVLVGWLLLFGGVAHLLYAFRARGSSEFGMMLLGGGLYAAVGLLMLFFPLQGVLTLTLLLAAFFLIEGLFKMAMALQMRPLAGWGWVLTSGFLAVLIGGLIWLQWPSDASWVIGLLVGIDMICGGSSMIVLALAARNQQLPAE